jgi:hypothetical protein
MAFRFGYLHSFACSGADEIGFELGHHSEDVEQQPPNRVCRVVHGSTDAELHTLDLEPVDDVFRVPEGTGQSVKFGNDESVTVDVKAQADEINTLLPTTSAPSSALICFYGSQPDSAVAATGRKLAGEIRLDQVDASRLAVSANKISIAAPPAGAVNCPMDTGAVTIIAFAYPASTDVDLWWKSDGCQLIDNGRIGASQLASPSFAAFQQVFKSITAG